MSSEYTAERIERAVSSASREFQQLALAAETVREAVHRLALMAEPGYGGNICALVELLGSDRTAEEVRLRTENEQLKAKLLVADCREEGSEDSPRRCTDDKPCGRHLLAAQCFDARQAWSQERTEVNALKAKLEALVAINKKVLLQATVRKVPPFNSFFEVGWGEDEEKEWNKALGDLS